MPTPKQARHCPNDGCVIPMVAELRNWPSPLVRFFWCHWCQELFAIVGENELGGRLTASFSYDREKATFAAWKTFGDARDVGLVQEVMAKMTFTPGVQDAT